MHPDELAPSCLVDMAVLGNLFQENRPRLVAMVQRRLDPALASRVDAEDIVNDAFLLARRKWARFKEVDCITPFTWLFRIVLDCLIESWRRETRPPRDARKNQLWPQQSSVELGLRLMATDTSPTKAAVRAELQQHMRQALDQLKDDDREIVWLRHYDQLSFKEAAEVLDISESAATLRYVRALKRLKALWQKLYPHEESRP
jgi:RNA polymerase sigma-70 factor, ECF subfamily